MAIPSTTPGVLLDLEASTTVDLAPGQAVKVMLRPTAVRICRPDARAAVLRAIVRDGAYHGRGYDYLLELGQGVELTGVFSSRRLARGDRVGVVIDPAGALVFGEDATRPAPPVSVQALVRPVAPHRPRAFRAAPSRPRSARRDDRPEEERAMYVRLTRSLQLTR